jgi:hypothetical protein
MTVFFVPQNVYEWIDMFKNNHMSVAEKLQWEHPSILTVEGNFNEFGTQILSNGQWLTLSDKPTAAKSRLVLFLEPFTTHFVVVNIEKRVPEHLTEQRWRNCLGV